MKHFLAFDFGAESGRAMLGSLDDGKLALEELHRFPNTPVRIHTALYWDVLRLFHEVQRGLFLAGRERRLTLEGIGVDTWGVDFALLDECGALIDNPRHYRDSRNNGMLEAAFARIPSQEIFRQTGIQFMQINTLFQLYAMRLQNPPALDRARTLLMMPDLFNYWLTGVSRCELTDASTTQFYNPVERRWATELFEKLDLPPTVLGEIVSPGTRLGTLLDSVAGGCGLAGTAVYATASHDTASAVAAVPATGRNWCYISSGTWSLMGVELNAPVINNRSLTMNLTNEVGAGGTIRLLKNITGLWPLQECRRAWALEGRDFSYEELVRMAADAPPFLAILNPDAFSEPGDMPNRIAAWCRGTGQKPPSTPAEYTRSILESLALRYRQVLEMLEALLGNSDPLPPGHLLHNSAIHNDASRGDTIRIETIHIVGGGSQNHLLNQLVADATGRKVVAGPAEATAAGNILVQAIGAGIVRDLAEARRVVQRSFPVRVFEPESKADWEAGYRRYLELVSA